MVHDVAVIEIKLQFISQHVPQRSALPHKLAAKYTWDAWEGVICRRTPSLRVANFRSDCFVLTNAAI